MPLLLFDLDPNFVIFLTLKEDSPSGPFSLTCGTAGVRRCTLKVWERIIV